MNTIRIGVMGLEYRNKNKGCEALSYSFAHMINEIAQKNKVQIELYIIRQFRKEEYLRNFCMLSLATQNIYKKYGSKRRYSNVNFHFAFFLRKNGLSIRSIKFKTLDYVVDFKYGDSFTDIYGNTRFDNGCAAMELFLNHNISLILGSQTIGPFQTEEHISRAAQILNKSKLVYARDEKSFNYVKEISSAEPILTTDIAFMLPYEKTHIASEKKMKIGLNVSGLLWCGGYTKDNQFGLALDYKKYTFELISYLKCDESVELYLIPHVIDNITDGEIDNDMIAMRDILAKYPNTKIYEGDDDPISLKSFISGLDLLIGGRMHATIAAFSSGVPVIPVSYSRKFEGLYESLDYEYIIHGKTMSTEEALEKTIYYINNVETLVCTQNKGLEIANSRNDLLVREFEKSIMQISKK